MCTCVSKIWKSEYLKCWNADDALLHQTDQIWSLLDVSCLSVSHQGHLEWAQFSFISTFFLSICCLIVAWLTFPPLFSHVTFSWEALNPFLPWAHFVLMCKCSLNPVLTRTAVLQGQSVTALLSVICRCSHQGVPFSLLWQSTDINNLGYHNSKHQMTNKSSLNCGTVGSAHAHNA